ncbi:MULTISPECIES: ParB N-terminal domain-containing protein [Paraburkholderia]|uniref:ParB N-terminal domain-containing protein n=1 Tax=Paraburkholderia TaxID=1822464 RepID=UPI000378263E|nr:MULTISPECIES: ParB N-terminal domain-containing protein [Paraburkholderia]MDH6152608.1 ParB family protein of integrating conjugative element (PFGI_1 class) [Paraburkholderia sp. WSM4179]
MNVSDKPLSETREALAAQRLDVPPPGAQTPEPQLTSVIRLKITDVMVYERNPRRASHERIVELKESIRANGIEQIVTVTRRPDETRYVVAKGGNSRVTAATALHDETRDERFLYYDFIYVPYPGEAKLLAAHLRENDQRADLCFWDKANGYLALKTDLEAERSETLSLREFSRLLEQEGAPVSHVLLSLFQFAVDRLSALGPATAYLSRRALVDVIQPGIGMLLRLTRRLGFDDQWLQVRVIDPQLTGIAARRNPDNPDAGGTLAQSAPFDAAQLVDGLRQRLAGELGVPRDAMDRMCHLLERTPNAAGDDLREVGGMPGERREPSSIASDVDANRAAATPDPSASSGPVRLTRFDEQPRATPAADGTVPRPTSVGQRRGESVVSTDGPPRAPDDPSTVVADDVHRDSTLHAASSSNQGELLRETVLTFARTCGLDGCVRDAPALPYGFMVEPPPPDRPRFSPGVAPGLSPGVGAQRDEEMLNRYLGWWWLVSLSRQNTATGIARVPSGSLFAQMARDDETWNRTCDASVGEPLLADRMDVMFDVMLNPDHPIGQWWDEVIRAARAFRAAYPERFAPARWPEPGADERLQRGGA